MRPNLAFGPIDSIAQYLLYLSVVVLGVLLPLLVQKWRVRREKAKLLLRTVEALTAEVKSNRRRVALSQVTFTGVADSLGVERAAFLAWRQCLLTPELPKTSLPPAIERNINLPLLTRTAWDVARLADALVLLPDLRLNAFARAYQMQLLFEQDRTLLLQTVMQLEVLDLPIDTTQLAAVDARLQVLAVGHTVLRYHAGLAAGMVQTYDDALLAKPVLAAATLAMVGEQPGPSP